MNTHLVKSFSDPVGESQQVFRKVLLSLSEPGQWQTLKNCETLPNFYPSTLSIILTLLDADTTVWLSERCQTPMVKTNLTFHCGCKISTEQSEAQFAIYDLDEFMQADNLQFSMGNERYPDLSTTIVLQLPESMDLSETVWSGPGIQESRICSLPIPQSFWAKRQSMVEFPRGIDFIFTQGNRVMGLPRSTRISVEGDNPCM